MVWNIWVSPAIYLDTLRAVDPFQGRTPVHSTEYPGTLLSDLFDMVDQELDRR